MTAGVKFAKKDQEKRILVPTAALTQINNKMSVWVIDKNNIAYPREVVAGMFNEYGTEIKSGLKADEVIAIAGVHTLIKGQKVKPIFADNPSEQNKTTQTNSQINSEVSP